MTNKMRFNGRCAMGGAGLLAAAAGAAGQVMPGNQTVQLVEVASGLVSPIQMTNAGDGSGRVFVVDQAGQIRVIDGGVLLPTPFLDLSAAIPALNTNFDERGLLGLAFHPDYANNGRFFVRHSAARVGVAGEPCVGTSRGCHTEMLVEFHVSAGDPNIADPVGTTIFEVDEPEWNHNGGGIAFGPDNMLYFTLGDGGGRDDGLSAVPPAHGPIGNAQNINTVLGSILRIDIDGGVPYAIPAGNPFPDPNGRGAAEIYAYGLRNPYRFSFDDGPGGTGELYLSDVGQDLFEEVDLIEVGGNYGWVTREGLECFDPFNPTVPPVNCAVTGPRGEPLIDPVAAYDHTDGIAIIGGHVYRGSQSPDLVGKYVFGDFSRSFAPEGRLFYIDPAVAVGDVFEFQIGALNEPLGLYVLGFGEGEDGEVYVSTSAVLGPKDTTGQVFRIVADNCAADCDVSTGVGVLDIFDFLCFQDAFVSAHTYACDCDTSTGPAICDIFDFLCFQDAFVLGCQ
jgi:glucose/arabinose dehydrogenase